MKEEIKDIPFFDEKSFLKKDEKVYIQLSTEFPEYVGVLHRHEFIEIVYILSGEAVHKVGDREYSVKSGDITLINSGVPHRFTPLNKENFVAYDLMYMPEFFDALGIEMMNFKTLKNSFLFYSLFHTEESSQPDMYIEGKRYSNYGEIFTKMYQEFNKKEIGYLELIRAYVIELIINMFRDIEQSGCDELSPEKTQTVNQAIEFIQKNYNLNLSINEIANKVFLGPDYFRKIFKKVTGKSISTFRQELRIDEACRLLSTTKEPIKDISYRIGYTDIKTFYQTFKKMTGKTPKEYREKK